MNASNKTSGRPLWVAMLLLSAYAAGCHADETGAAPTARSTYPDGTVTALPINHKITATFSEAMDASTINGFSFTVTAPGEAAVIGTVNLDNASNTAVFKPSSNFGSSTVYTATLTTDAKNTSGMPLANAHAWTFTSAAAIDTHAPTVSSTNPASTIKDFALNASISAEFSEALDPVTVNNTSFTLTDGTTPVAGAVIYGGSTVTFKPTSNLAANTVYTATLKTAVTDLAVPANALANDYVWTFTTGTAVAAGPAAVDLRTAGDFVILSKTGITNVPASNITGNIGASPITAAAMGNVTCAEITGTIYGADAAYTGSGDVTCFVGAASDNAQVANAVLDLGTAYADAAGRTVPDHTELHAGDISGKTLYPGLYKWSSNVLISTDVTLSGGPNDVWIFQIAGDLTQANSSSIVLAGGAQAKNIYWQVGGGTSVALGTNAHFEGVILAAKGITIKTGTTVNGRLLAHTAVTLQQNVVAEPAP
ncbi:ice-binding family protein [Pseudomonas paeninsulae]|uniref:ice-binding family protein n=1 Tax=Pseudomonas paeninsulae TaxID=3110772 RepID=UPI002D76F40F|nr:ice-binding family protein [Pseudomonas sp. IT1137]